MKTHVKLWIAFFASTLLTGLMVDRGAGAGLISAFITFDVVLCVMAIISFAMGNES